MSTDPFVRHGETGTPDPGLGLENAKESKKGEPIDLAERDKQVVVGPEGGTAENQKAEAAAEKKAAKKAAASDKK